MFFRRRFDEFFGMLLDFLERRMGGGVPLVRAGTAHDEGVGRMQNEIKLRFGAAKRGFSREKKTQQPI